MGQATMILVLLGLAGFSYASKLHNHNIQPSFSYGESLVNDVQGGYLPPTPEIPCPPAVTITETDYSVYTDFQYSTEYNNVVITRTHIQTTTEILPATITNTETIINTVYNTQYTTVIDTQTRTEVQTSYVTQPGYTQFVTKTQTVPTVVYVDTTSIKGQTNIIPKTIFKYVTRTKVIPTQVVKYVTNTVTNTVVKNIPGQKIINTKYTTVTNVVTKTIPAQTITNTIYKTSVITNTISSTIGGGLKRVYSTQIVPIATTVFTTQYVTYTKYHTVNSNVYSTSTLTKVSTLIIPTTIYQENTQYTTINYDHVITSVVTSPILRTREVVSARARYTTQTVDVTKIHEDIQVVTVGGGVSTVVSTTLVVTNVVNTSIVTNHVDGGVVTVTETVTGGYCYNPPSIPSYNNFRK